MVVSPRGIESFLQHAPVLFTAGEQSLQLGYALLHVSNCRWVIGECDIERLNLKQTRRDSLLVSLPADVVSIHHKYFIICSSFNSAVSVVLGLHRQPLIKEMCRHEKQLHVISFNVNLRDVTPTWLLRTLSSSSLFASAMFRRSIVVSSECALLSRSWIWCIRFSARPTRTWLSVSRSFSANFIRWRSPSSPRRISSAFVSRFSASSRLIRSCFLSSSSLASDSFSFWIFSWNRFIRKEVKFVNKW